MAEEAAPSGFEDAGGCVVPLDDEEVGRAVPPYRNVAFSVADADAAVDAAASAGADVLVAPFDVEPVRMAVLRDPQGAVFTVSRYQPARQAEEAPAA